MDALYRDVLEFARLHGHAIGTAPSVPIASVAELRERLIVEESRELVDAMEADDLPAIAKEAMDVVYVVVGTLVAYGIDPVEVWKEVHKSNMTKAVHAGGRDSKVKKGDGYIPPDIEGILATRRPASAS